MEDENDGISKEDSVAKEPRPRLNFKQAVVLTEWCKGIAEKSYDTWTAMALAASESLSFGVTVYSLKLALDAAGRNIDEMLRTASSESTVESRLAAVELQVGKVIETAEGSYRQVALLEQIVNKILNQTTANEVA